MSERSERIQELKRDLQDGDDLAQALAFIGDVLHRRIRRVHRSLDSLLREGGSDVDRLERRVRDTLRRYESELTSGQERLQAVIEQFQGSLDEEAERLEAEAEGDAQA